VEDLPDYLDRIEACIHQLDRPPKQVQIEAHILEVDLSADNRHGVNLEMMSDIAGTKVSLKTPGFAKSTSNPALLV
jgi:type II secretory pathway component GspD/PulD (secretin)